MIINSQENTNSEHPKLCAQLHDKPHFGDEHLRNNFLNIFTSNQLHICYFHDKFFISSSHGDEYRNYFFLGVLNMIYLLTAIGLSPGGSTHLHTNNTQNNTNNK
jgi:hypothetical protein